MQIQVNTDNNVHGREDLVRRVEAEIDESLGRFAARLTRVEVHLGDEAAGRSEGEDLRCTIEARPAGQPPVAVTHHAGSIDEAYRGAAQKLARLLDTRFGRIDIRKGGDTVRGGR